MFKLKKKRKRKMETFTIRM